MADFPTAVFNPASRSAGQSIASAHVNSLQAEVTAIEDGYRNATAPLNSSGSTVATLSVLGGSTFASRPVEPPPHAARVALASTFAVGNGLTVTLDWATGDYLTNSSMFSSPSSVLTPQSTGLYHAAAQVRFSNNSTGDRYVGILDSSGVNIAESWIHASSHSGSLTVLNITGTKRFDALGGNLKVNVYQANASTLSVVIAGSWFELRKL